MGGFETGLAPSSEQVFEPLFIAFLGVGALGNGVPWFCLPWYAAAFDLFSANVTHSSSLRLNVWNLTSFRFFKLSGRAMNRFSLVIYFFESVLQFCPHSFSFFILISFFQCMKLFLFFQWRFLCIEIEDWLNPAFEIYLINKFHCADRKFLRMHSELIYNKIYSILEKK